MNDTLNSALVHPPEINVEEPETPPIATPDVDSLGSVQFRHSGWATWRTRVHTALCNTAQETSRIEAFDTCGSHAWIAEDPENQGKYKVTCDKCHDRFCTPCSNERARRSARVIAEYVKEKRLRFLTLTLRTEDEPLTESINRLISSFRKLRGRDFWKRHVFGGASFLEVKWNAESGRWHPHLHVLTEGRFMERRIVSTEWYTCTGDSYVIDIREVKDQKRASEYVAKYATKGYNSSVFHDKARLEEAIVALRRRRLVGCFGKWRGFSINDDENEEHWTPVCPLTSIRDLAAAGSKWAQRLLQHLADPDSYHSPGTMPVEECLKLGRPPPFVPGDGMKDDGSVSLAPPSPLGKPTFVGITPANESGDYDPNTQDIYGRPTPGYLPKT